MERMGFMEWLESLRERPFELDALCDEVNQWLTWLDRRFDRQTVNDRLRQPSVPRKADRVGSEWENFFPAIPRRTMTIAHFYECKKARTNPIVAREGIGAQAGPRVFPHSEGEETVRCNKLLRVKATTATGQPWQVNGANPQK